jgi:hypothetical protein
MEIGIAVFCEPENPEKVSCSLDTEKVYFIEAQKTLYIQKKMCVGSGVKKSNYDFQEKLNKNWAYRPLHQNLRNLSLIMA